jgi:hypothetical protein
MQTLPPWYHDGVVNKLEMPSGATESRVSGRTSCVANNQTRDGLTWVLVCWLEETLTPRTPVVLAGVVGAGLPALYCRAQIG